MLRSIHNLVNRPLHWIKSKIRLVIVMAVTVSLLSFTGIAAILFNNQEVKNEISQLNSVIKNAIQTKFDFSSANDVTSLADTDPTNLIRDVGSRLP